MKRYGFLALTAIALTVVGCQRSQEVSETDASEPPVENLTQSLPTPPDGTVAKPRISTDFSSSANQAAKLRQARADSADASTSLAASLKQNLGAGRDNPFRSVHQPQVEVTYVTESAAAPKLPEVPQVVTATAPTVPAVPATTATGASPTPLTTAPVTTVVTAAPLPMPVAPAVLPNVVPPIALPQAALVAPMPVSPTAIAESIEIKGVIQVGEQFNIIIRDPNAPTSRTVKVGDVVGGGKVRISRVDAADTQDPQVVLEQDGVEVVRAVGV